MGTRLSARIQDKETEPDFAAVCIPPNYNLDRDSTDSELTLKSIPSTLFLSARSNIPGSKSSSFLDKEYPKAIEPPALLSKSNSFSALPTKISIQSEKLPLKGSTPDPKQEAIKRETINLQEKIKELLSKFTRECTGMSDFSRYSREPPEKEFHADDRSYDEMSYCCRPCDNLPPKCPPFKKPNCKLRYTCRDTCDGYQDRKERRISDSYVACRNLDGPHHWPRTPPHSRSASLAVDKYQNPHQEYPPVEINSQHRRFPKSQPNKGHPRDMNIVTNTPIRSYPPGNYSGRPHIPLPPPPPHKSTSLEVRDMRRGQPKGNKQYQNEVKRGMQENYKYCNTNKMYPYEDPSSSGCSQEESFCNQCDYYDHCPVHSICKCQCLCAQSENWVEHTQSDDNLSYCSDSSQSAHMNLAYQRTGDYPELMDELENTLSHRNRMRVQKTRQRFEMLSRQNKNLDKPIFDDESVDCKVHPMQNHHQHHTNRKECKYVQCKNQTSVRFNTGRSGCNSPTEHHPNSEKVNQAVDSYDSRRNKEDSGSDCRQQMSEEQTGNASWQLDTSRGEWIKVGNRQTVQYDFENSYPPLPPRPISSPLRSRQNFNDRKSPMYFSSKCARHNR